MRKITIFMLMSIIVLFTFSCKSQKNVVHLKDTKEVKDSVTVMEKVNIILPRKSEMVFHDVFTSNNEINIPTQIVTNENTTFKIQKIGNDLSIKFKSDSIISTDKESEKIKIVTERIEVPVEVEVPVKNKLNWYLLLYSITSTILLFRKQIWWVVKKFIFPLFI